MFMIHINGTHRVNLMSWAIPSNLILGLVRMAIGLKNWAMKAHEVVPPALYYHEPLEMAILLCKVCGHKVYKQDTSLRVEE